MKGQNTISNPFVILLTLLLGLIFFASACQQADRETAAAQNEELVNSYIEAFNAQDRAAMEKLLSDPFTYQEEEMDLETYLESAEGFWKAFPDMKFDPTHLLSTEGYVTVRGVLTGTGEGVYRGHALNGQEFEITEIILFHVQEDKIAEAYAEWDDLDLWEQLGVVEL